jgi:hypothetical protein
MEEQVRLAVRRWPHVWRDGMGGGQGDREGCGGQTGREGEGRGGQDRADMRGQTGGGDTRRGGGCARREGGLPDGMGWSAGRGFVGAERDGRVSEREGRRGGCLNKGEG